MVGVVPIGMGSSEPHAQRSICQFVGSPFLKLFYDVEYLIFVLRS